MNIKELDTSNFADFDDHETVLQCDDPSSGLSALIAIHNRNLGPSLGGCRLRGYDSNDDAITDVLRLSRGMTYKSAMASLPLGGGKSVINVPASAKTDAMMAVMGQFVDSLGGQYVVAEDSGTTVADMQAMARHTDHVAGLKEKQLSDGRVVDGDPSRSTAYGVYCGIDAAVRYRLGVESLENVRVAIQGVGHVGAHLARLLAEAGANLVVADLEPARINALLKDIDAMVVDVEKIHRTPCDVFAPCALGGVITFDSLNEMPARIIAGAANNQLATDTAGYELFARGKLYVPDYVINAGGIIDIFYEREGYDHEKVIQHIDHIKTTLLEVFEKSREHGEPTHVIADRIARERFAHSKHERRVDVA